MHRIVVGSSILMLVLSCSSPAQSPAIDASVVDAPPPLPALPSAQPVETEQFASASFCAQCHFRGDTETLALSDTEGNDISPGKLWRSSMMGLAARDPFYLSVFEEELAANPAEKASIDALCTRCHAPAASVASEREGEKIGFEALTSAVHKNASLGRDGITCSLCHQIRSQGLGNESSFTGGFTVGFSRKIFGPHANPTTSPMQMFVRYTPEFSEHMKDSSLCATCHTVIVPGPNGEVVEQAPYLEWQNSSYNNESNQESGRSCQGCHMPRVDEQGDTIATAIAKFPDDLVTRGRYSQHTLVGGNSFMLRLFAAFEDWTQSGVPADELLASAGRSENHLREAATLIVDNAVQNQGSVSVRVEVSNKTGHKLPTGYPTRRVWVRFVASDSAGQVVFESGGFDSDGRIVGIGEQGAILPHYEEISDSGQVQVYQQVLVDQEGIPTIRSLDAASVGKDNRILPLGWSSSYEQIGRIQPVGIASDTDFVAGSDTLVYRFPYTSASALDIRVELLYQSVPPKVIDTVADFRNAAGARFVQMARATDNQPVEMASAELQFVP